jgi:hypothetical protein
MAQPRCRWVPWVLLIVCSIARPASAQDVDRKQLYQSNITITLSGISDVMTGSAMLIATPTGYDFFVRAHYYGPEVTKVSLKIAGDLNARQIILCDNSAESTCTYRYHLNTQGSIDPMMLLFAENGPVSADEFKDALLAGHLLITFDDGERGEGCLTRIF